MITQLLDSSGDSFIPLDEGTSTDTVRYELKYITDDSVSFKRVYVEPYLREEWLSLGTTGIESIVVTPYDTLRVDGLRISQRGGTPYTLGSQIPWTSPSEAKASLSPGVTPRAITVGSVHAAQERLYANRVGYQVSYPVSPSGHSWSVWTQDRLHLSRTLDDFNHAGVSGGWMLLFYGNLDTRTKQDFRLNGDVDKERRLVDLEFQWVGLLETTASEGPWLANIKVEWYGANGATLSTTTADTGLSFTKNNDLFSPDSIEGYLDQSHIHI